MLLSAKLCGEGCCMRTDSEGMVRRAEGEIGVIKWWLGSVNVPM